MSSLATTISGGSVGGGAVSPVAGGAGAGAAAGVADAATATGSVESLTATFQVVCSKFQDSNFYAEADKWLQRFRFNPSVMPVAQKALESSTLPYAQFQALTAIRDVTLRTWSTLNATHIDEVQRFLLQHVLTKWNSMKPYVREAALQVVAVVLKRRWLQATPAVKQTVFGQVEALLGGKGAAAGTTPEQGRMMGVCLLRSLLTEFSQEQARVTAMGMALEFHTKCSASFQEQALKRVWQLAAGMLKLAASACAGKSTAAAIKTGSAAGILGTSQVKLLAMLLDILETCLQWDFDGTGGASDTKTVVTPGAAWTDVLLEPGLVPSLFSLYESVKFLYSTPLPHRVRQVLLLLSALSGPVFASPATKLKHVLALLHGWVPLMSKPLTHGLGLDLIALGTKAAELAEAAGSESVAVSQALTRLATTYGMTVLGTMTTDVFQRFLQELVGMSTRLLDAALTAATMRLKLARKEVRADAVGGLEDYLDVEQTWNLESFGNVMDALVSLLLAMEDGDMMHPGRPKPPHAALLNQCAASVFIQLVRKRLDIATATVAAGIDDDDPYEDPLALDQHLESAAVLARALPEKTLPVLTALTREQTQQLRNGAVAGATAAAAVGGAGAGAGAGAAGATGGQLALQCVNERLFWLVWFSGFVLTDAAEGEVPCIPAAMNAASTRASRAASGGHKFGATVEAAVTADPVVQLVTALLQLLELESQWMQARAQDENLSPLVCTKLMWFLDRWCRSYLMPDISNYRTTAVSPTLTRCYAATAATAAGSAAAAGGASPVAKSPYIGGGDAVLNFVLQKATLVLAKFATEQDMCEAAVDVLKAVHLSKGARGVAVTSATWAALCQAHAAMVAGSVPAGVNLGALAGITTLPSDLQMALTSVIVGATRSLAFDADAMPGRAGDISSDRAAVEAAAKAAAQSRQMTYYKAVVTPIQTKLRQLFELPAFKSAPFPAAAQQPATLQEVERIIKLCEGVVCPAFRVDVRWTVDIGVATLSMCARLIDGYKAATVVTPTALSFARNFTGRQLPTMGSAGCVRVYKAVGEVLAAYTKHRAGKPYKLSDESDLSFEEVKTLLELLMNLINKDDLDFSDEPVDAAGPVADVVFYGLKLIIPIVTKDLMNFPALSSLFLRIVSDMAKVYPEKVAQLDAGLFKSMLAVLQHGIQYHKSTIQRCSMEAVFALVQFHAEAVTAVGGPAAAAPNVGFMAHRAADPHVLSRLLKALFQAVLTPGCASEVVAAASNALLALIVCEQDAYRSLVGSFAAAQRTAEHKARLEQAFADLTGSGGVAMSFTRPNRLRFQQNLKRFVDTVRAFAIVK